MTHTPIQLIVGLCNPGDTYAHTRHNAGADFVTEFARVHNALPFKKETRFQGLHGKPSIGALPCHCLLPTTYMNHSGQSVNALVQFYKIPVESILVVHDELDLSPGTLRLKQGGGHGGHNGLRDIIEQLGSCAFLRLRVGIGRPLRHPAVADYVLMRPSTTDAGAITTAIDAGLRVMPTILQGNIAAAMQVLHTNIEEENDGI